MKKLNKNNWKEVEIGEYVDHIEINERNPDKRKDAKYVSVEHTSILDLRINGIASEEQPSFNRTFKTGQILFAKRWAISTPYPSKLAVADFDGICSPHLWALETKNGLLQSLLPFILQTNSFFEHANKNSAGSLAGVYLKWEPFSQYKFKLPPPFEQEQINNLLKSMVAVIEQLEGQEKNLYQLKHKLLKDLCNEKQEFGNHLKAKDFETVKFEKIAFNISERVEPKKTELKTYVGLEHLAADNLNIERTGTPDDVIGTKLKIYKGDIIFGKRRAYLRKVAVSHFDGIASAHSMILRANEKNIEKDFLPYFMQSDTFMSRAVQISEGSLSPTIKNKTLAVQEFILPKKEKQKELISVFKQFDTTMEQLKQQKTTLKNLKQKLLNEILG